MASLYKGQTVCRMQAIRHENLLGLLQTSDRKPVGLPFRLKELRTFACFPLIKECSISPCKAEGFAQPRAVGLPTCEALQGFTPTQKWGRHFCRQQTTFAALRSPALSRTGNVSHAFICEAFLHYYLVYKKAFRLPLVIRMVSQSLSLAHQLCFPLFKRSGINYPPSDKQMVPLSLQKGVTCCLLSFARRSVYPERMYVGALTSSWQVGAIPQELQGYGFCE